MSIDKFNIASLSLQPTAALLNAQLDFSLVKLVAPPEYRTLGTTLSLRRREAAEDGTQHRTARKLGALFDRILPNCPNLIKAYGKRSSEISQLANPKDQERDVGAFSSHQGIDATSIWAAATSGSAAIYVHLLACLLARAWTGPQAIAIWVEIVEERIRTIMSEVAEGVLAVPIESIAAARQGISRHDLSQWDASARAWLQIADGVENKRQKQLMLILDNLDLPVSQKPDTYGSVMDVWKSALLALDKLVSGQAQRTSNASSLLGLACWHLFPDLIVLGQNTTEVRFGDGLVAASGILTVGLNASILDKRGIYWSLSLAHLRYYGDPVPVTSSSARDSTRLSMHDFGFIVLGCVIADWGNYPDIVDGAVTFFSLLRAYKLEQEMNKNSSSAFFSCFGPVLDVADNFRQLKDDERQQALTLIAVGMRKAYSLLSKRVHRPPPFFGLLDAFIIWKLKSPTRSDRNEASIAMMRYFASALQLHPSEGIISNRDFTSRTTISYLTAVHFADCAKSGSEDAVQHRRWLVRPEMPPSMRLGCNCHSSGHSCHEPLCACIQVGLLCSVECHSEFIPAQKGCRACFQSRTKSEDAEEGGLEMRGASETSADDSQLASNECPNLKGFELLEYRDDSTFLTYNQSSARFRATLRQHGIGLRPWDFGATRATKTHKPQTPTILQSSPDLHLCDCFSTGNWRIYFGIIASSADGVSLFLRYPDDLSEESLASREDELRRARSAARSRNTKIPVDRILELMQGPDSLIHRVVSYLDRVMDTGIIEAPTLSETLHIAKVNIFPYIVSMRAFVLARAVYACLPGATIAMRLMSFQLHHSHWLPKVIGERDWHDLVLTRTQKLACIAMFESGAYNLVPSDLTDVMAISSRNNIFLSRQLDRDPFTLDHRDEIVLVVGNVGRAGMALLVAPQAPRIREPKTDHWTQVAEPFSEYCPGSFGSTSLHLSFTDYEMPFDVGNRGGIDNDLCFIETVISVFDRGEWLADLDALALYKQPQRLLARDDDPAIAVCDHSTTVPEGLVTINKWEELVDAPVDLGEETTGVICAGKNWMARIAAACIGVQRGYRVVLVAPENKEKRCFECLLAEHDYWAKAEAEEGEEIESAVGLGAEGEEDRDNRNALDGYRSDSDDGSDAGSTGTAIEFNDFHDNLDNNRDERLGTRPHLVLL